MTVVATDPNAVITPNTDASINGVYNDNPALTMSGTFQVGYQGQYTRPLNAESSVDQLRYALKDLDTIQTVGVAQEQSYQPLEGKVDVTEGEIFVTCSAGETCNFYAAAYGLPGYPIRIGGDWYTIRTDLVSPGLSSTQLYLGDLNGREVGYLGPTQTAVTVYEWTKGYVWTVDLLSTTKKLTMGQQYYIEAYAYNDNGKGAVPVDGSVTATPCQVPAAPSNVNLAVVSGKEIEVFFSPPPLATTNVNPNFINDISSYIVQWDTTNTFKHGRLICANCATSLNVNTLLVSTSLMNLVMQNTKFTVADGTCVLTVNTRDPTTVQVFANHGCPNFNGQTYSLYYYTYPPSILSGSSIQGSPPFRYVISGLTVSTTYYVRVAAVNSVPVQQIALNGEPPDNRKWSYYLTATTADRVPDPPLSVYLNPYSSTILELQIQPSTRDGQGTNGVGITGFWIDVDTVSTFDSASKLAPVEVPSTSLLIPELYAGGPRIYYLTGLTTGTRYYAQVKTINSIGYSRATIAPAPQTPTKHPSGPVNVKLSLTGYKVEWWRLASRPEIQTVELKWTTPPTAAPFTLSFGGLTTPALPMDISAANLRFALMSLASVTSIPIGQVTVTRSAVNVVQGYQWSVTFDNTNVNAGNQPLLQFSQDPTAIAGGAGIVGRTFEVQSGIAPPAGNAFPGKQEVQVLVTYHATTTVGGYFRLSYKGSAWTNFLPATVSAANLKSALEALPTIGVVSVNSETMLLSGAAWSIGSVWTITFQSNVGNLAPLIVDTSMITPTTAYVLIKDGVNAVDTTGLLCLPDGTSGCPGSWPAGIKNLKQQAAPLKSIAQLATVGEAAVDYGYYETLDGSTLTYTISGLTPGLSYQVSVAAKNPKGYGHRTLSSPAAVTPPLQVPGPPVNVSVDVNPGVSTQLVATWAAPASDGGSPVWMYRVEYDASSLFTDRGQQDQWCPVAPTPAVWTVQTIRTSAPATSPIASGYFKLELTRNNIVELSDPIPWNAVAEASNEASSVTSSSSGVFCTYNILYAQVRPGVMPPACTGSQVIPNSGALNKGELYYVRVFAYNQIGFGNPQLAAAPQKPMVVPGAPTGVTLAVLTVSELVVLFNPHDDNGGDTVTGYEVQWATDSVFTSPSSTTVQLTTGMSSPYKRIISALTKGTSYYVRVSARNSQGLGQLQVSSPVSQQPYTTPSSPTQVVLGITSSTMLTVGWAPPTDDGGDAISGYVVQWDVAATFDSLATAGSTTAVINDATQRSYTITLLTPGTRYYVRVFAQNLADMVYGGVSLESYLVQYAVSSDFSLATEVDVTTTSAMISGLTSAQPYYVRVLTVNSQGLNSDFCTRANAQSFLCPDHLVLEDGSVVTGDFVFAAPQ
ncbi:Projectin/twitchin [Phytophthora cinnamomi]|uniref:Projectin/twitchin n=1 Tax=Phytophthora cinnamomi TaxID=4785 RepID=UPI003559ACBF|nr:Projectin/twitchin [Phytophthora cinnamomi]